MYRMNYTQLFFYSDFLDQIDNQSTNCATQQLLEVSFQLLSEDLKLNWVDSFDIKKGLSFCQSVVDYFTRAFSLEVLNLPLQLLTFTISDKILTTQRLGIGAKDKPS